MKPTILTVLVMSVLLASQSASAKRFYPPEVNNRVVHPCASGPYFTNSTRCAKQGMQYSADTFCKKIGFKYALKYSWSKNKNRTRVSAVFINKGKTYFTNRYWKRVFTMVDCRR